MAKQKINTFQENIKYTFTKYAIIPVFLTILAFLALFLGVWHYSIHRSNRDVMETIEKSFKHTVFSYRSLLNDLARDDALFTRDKTSKEILEINRKIYSVNSHAGYDADLALYDPELRELNDRGRPGREPDKQISWGVFHDMRENPEEICIGLLNEDKNYLAIGRSVEHQGEIQGYIVAKIHVEEFDRLLASVSNQLVVTDPNGWIYLADSYIFEDELGRLDRDLIGADGYVKFKDRGYYLSSKPILNGALYLYTSTDYPIDPTLFLMIFALISLIFAVMIFLIHITSGMVTRKTSQEIGEIAAAFEEARQGNLEAGLDVDSSLELKQIGDSYNDMVEGLKKYINRNQELTDLAAYAQIKQLEAQFNPHFLFNTLDNIRFMGRIDPPTGDKMIIALSRILRYSISDTNKVATVREDMENIENYLTILKLRFSDRFAYRMSIEEGIKDCRIPKLMFQSLIENSVKHGYGQDEPLEIEIKGYEQDGDLIFECIDNGVGIEAELLEEIKENLAKDKNPGNHHGLYNIHKRIRLMCGGDYGVEIESEVGKGTKVTLRMPQRAADDCDGED